MNDKGSGRNGPGLARGALVIFVFPAFSINIFVISLYSFLPPFYSGPGGLGLALTGTIFMVLRLGDLAIDPLIGNFIDRRPTRWGRRHPWIIASLPFFMIGAWLLFFPPLPASPAYLAMALTIMFAGFTLFYVTYLAWAAELSGDYDERSRVMGWIQFAAQLGIAAALIGAAYVAQTGVAIDGQVRLIGLLVLALMPIAGILLLWRGPRPVAIRDMPDKTVSIAAIASILRHAALRRILISNAALGCVSGLIVPLLFFFVDQSLALPGWAPVALLVMVLGCLPLLPASVSASRRFGKHAVLGASAIVGLTGSAALGVMPRGAIAGLMIASLMFGSGLGLGFALTRAMLADAVDLDAVTSGSTRTGLIYAVQLSIEKIGPAVGLFSGYIIIALAGFDPGRADNPASALASLRYLVGGGGVIFYAVIVLAMAGYRLDRATQRRLQADLAGAVETGSRTQ